MRRYLFLLATATLALTAACGSSTEVELTLDLEQVPEGIEPLPEGDVTAAHLASAASQARSVETGRFEMEMTMGATSGAEDVAFSFSASGAFDDRVPAVTMTMDMGGMMAEIAALEGEALPPGFDGDWTIEMIQIGDVMYMQMPMGELLGGMGGTGASGDSWIKMDAGDMAEQSMSGADTMGMAPDEILGLLEGAGGEVSELGPGEVRGVPTQGYRVEISMGDAIASQATPEDAEALERAWTELGMETLADVTYPIEVHVDADGLVRRLSLELEMSGTDFPMAGGGAGVDGSFSMVMTMDLFDFGTDIEIVAPPADEVFDMSGMFGDFDMGDFDMDEMMGELDSMMGDFDMGDFDMGDFDFDEMMGEFDSLMDDFDMGDFDMGDFDMDEMMGELDSMMGDFDFDLDEMMSELERELDALLGDSSGSNAQTS